MGSHSQLLAFVIPKNDRYTEYRAEETAFGQELVIDGDLQSVIDELRDTITNDLRGGVRTWALGLLDEVEAANPTDQGVQFTSLGYYRTEIQGARVARGDGDTGFRPTKHILDLREDICTDLWKRADRDDRPVRRTELKALVQAVVDEIDLEYGTYDDEDG